jgi:hypothetical protein
VVSLNVDGPVAKLVMIDEWVMEAGNRLWIVRASAELESGNLGAQAGTGSEGLTITSNTLDRPTTLSIDPSDAAAASSAQGVQAAALSTPSWWQGDCDNATYSAGSGGRASYRLGEVYLGLPACGPRPWSDNAPDVLVRFFPGSWGAYEWQCVELSMRFMYLMYGINPYQGNGSQVVWNYTGSRLVKISNGTAGKAPQPNDILSYGSTSTAGHTAVVTSSSVDSNGNGTITVIEQNSAASGRSTLAVTNWTVSGNAGAISGWLHDATAGATPTSIFSDSFDRPDGSVQNGWAGSATLLNGELRTNGGESISRILPVTFPLTFSFDFRTDNTVNECVVTPGNDGGWRLVLDSADPATSDLAQVAFEQYAGSQNAIRRYMISPSEMAEDAAPVVSGQRDFGASPVRIEGTIFGDLSGAISFRYDDGNAPDPVVVTFGPAPNALDYQTGSNLLFGSPNCSSGPHYFDNFEVIPSGKYTISGNAGAAGVTLSYEDGGAKTATADAGGDYSFTVPQGWSGTVTPSKPSTTFAPASRDYGAVSTNQTDQDYWPLLSKTFVSKPSYDGSVSEASETSGQGGAISALETTLRVGDSLFDTQYRGILSFGTSWLPDNAVIVSATLRLRKHSTTGTNPFATHGNLVADVRKGAFSRNLALEPGDFQAWPNQTAVFSFPNGLVNGRFSAVMDSANFGFINKTGATQFRLRFDRDDNDDLADDFLSLYTADAPAGYRPQLVITYYLP